MVLRKAFDKENKDRETAATKAVRRILFSILQPLTCHQAIDALVDYFKQNEDAQYYFTELDVQGNAKVYSSFWSIVLF